MMKTVLQSTLHITLLLLFFNVLSAQECGKSIAENKTVSGTQVLSTEPFTVIVRGSYSYMLSFHTDEKGITASMYSKGGVIFNQDDEIIFLDGNKNRKSYRFG